MLFGAIARLVSLIKFGRYISLAFTGFVFLSAIQICFDWLKSKFWKYHSGTKLRLLWALKNPLDLRTNPLQ